ncbi:MAG TPA: HXXEE domain-containing protein [Tissierellales bacterium]|nr:HXXEE domain-containing protein [Tissierellales bacterium]
MFELLNLFLLFPLILTLHNIEESLWLTEWANSFKKSSKPMNKDGSIFTTIVTLSFAYLITLCFVFLPEVSVFKYLYFGFIGVMMFNVIFPHLALTIQFKKYCPGLITGILLLMPIGSLIIIYSINKEIISYLGLVIATIIVGLISLIILPVLFRMGEYFLRF